MTYRTRVCLRPDVLLLSGGRVVEALLEVTVDVDVDVVGDAGATVAEEA